MDPFDPAHAEQLADVSIRDFCQLLQEGDAALYSAAVGAVSGALMRDRLSTFKRWNHDKAVPLGDVVERFTRFVLGQPLVNNPGRPEPYDDYRGHAAHVAGTFATLALDLYSGKLQ